MYWSRCVITDCVDWLADGFRWRYTPDRNYATLKRSTGEQGSLMNRWYVTSFCFTSSCSLQLHIHFRSHLRFPSGVRSPYPAIHIHNQTSVQYRIGLNKMRGRQLFISPPRLFKSQNSRPLPLPPDSSECILVEGRSTAHTHSCFSTTNTGILKWRV